MPNFNNLRAAGVWSDAKLVNVCNKTTRLARELHQYAYLTRATFLQACARLTKFCKAMALR